MVHNKHQLLVRAVCSHRSFSVFVFFFFTLIYCSIFIWALLYVKSTSVSAPNQPEVKSKAIIIRRKRKKSKLKNKNKHLNNRLKVFAIRNGISMYINMDVLDILFLRIENHRQKFNVNPRKSKRKNRIEWQMTYEEPEASS